MSDHRDAEFIRGTILIKMLLNLVEQTSSSTDIFQYEEADDYS